ncbi:MAG: flagellar biosynthesis anti-sigma factor FlgM [Pseudomonadota bacterium]
MKIDNSLGPVGGLPGGDNKTRQARNTPPAGAASRSSSEVELSSIASKLQEVERALANVPVVDAERVAEIKQAIAEGRFKVDAGKVADGLIENVKQMLEAQARRA